MSIKTVNNLRLILCLVALAFFLLGKPIYKAAPGLGIVCLLLGVAALIADLVVYFVYYKCPWCDRLLPSRGVVLKHCPYCGEKLDN